MLDHKSVQSWLPTTDMDILYSSPWFGDEFVPDFMVRALPAGRTPWLKLLFSRSKLTLVAILGSRVSFLSSSSFLMI